jgi:hypothetical protein
MKRTSLLFAVPVVAGLLVSGCSKDEPAEIDLGHAYFPTNVGHWVEYQVDSMRVHLENNAGDTTMYSYSLREEITEEFTDGEGRPAQRIIRYLLDSNDAWIPKDVWWQTRDNVRAERSEEDRRRVKLVFPPRTTTFWNTNATNTDDAFELTYIDIDAPWSVNGLNFEKTITVIGTFTTNLIETRRYTERYAPDVGMIFHEVDSINSQPSLGDYDRWYVKYVIQGYGN